MKASVRRVDGLWIGIPKPAKAQNWMAGTEKTPEVHAG